MERAHALEASVAPGTGTVPKHCPSLPNDAIMGHLSAMLSVSPKSLKSSLGPQLLKGTDLFRYSSFFRGA